ncbi:putative ebp domain-containing protein [Venturia nashicola]|uniref:Putative ebp domain-containing protein n=1 Tax=Venturia nashicola TaxID=86259 RepID=A0A4Z1NQ29_9PEZI|nr:putative ebp domain-containing protein [Venturia nashicola]
MSPSPPLHPYYPLEAEITGYVANDRHFLALIQIFAFVCLVGLGATYAVCYYVYNFKTLASRQTLFGQLWKEYSHSDSRYLTQDPFVLCMETITALVWGPLSLLTAYLILTSHPLRHPLQIIVSLGHMYGDILYYGTSFFDHHVANISHCRPEPFYFYVYFVGMNAPWILIPAALMWRSMSYIGKAVSRLRELEGKKKI